MTMRPATGCFLFDRRQDRPYAAATTAAIPAIDVITEHPAAREAKETSNQQVYSKSAQGACSSACATSGSAGLHSLETRCVTSSPLSTLPPGSRRSSRSGYA